jgi:hypothetical protein
MLLLSITDKVKIPDNVKAVCKWISLPAGLKRFWMFLLLWNVEDHSDFDDEPTEHHQQTFTIFEAHSKIMVTQTQTPELLVLQGDYRNGPQPQKTAEFVSW